jgi:hypothetical protein
MSRFTQTTPAQTTANTAPNLAGPGGPASRVDAAGALVTVAVPVAGPVSGAFPAVSLVPPFAALSVTRHPSGLRWLKIQVGLKIQPADR